MPSVNKVFLVGHLGADPEKRSTPSGDTVTNFSMATSEKWRDKESGELSEKTQWHRVTVWRQAAEFVAEYCKKGHLVYVEGRVEYRKYEQDGVEKWATDIIAMKVEKLSSDAPAPDKNDEDQEDLGF